MKIKIPIELIEDGYISKRNNNDNTLFIHNYTPKTQYDRYWNEYTLMCRGLILDNEDNVVAVPFKKFFNYEELDKNQIPLNEKYEIYTKLDGSLIILFNYNNKWNTATRGSFNSDQSIKAQQIINDKYTDILSNLNPKFTYLFEILYRENKIVCDYGDIEDIVLLSIMNNETLNEVDLDYNLGFTVVDNHKIKVDDFIKLKELEEDNKEGFVVRFESGFRFKIKFNDYVLLHRILTGFSNKTIWESLKNNISLDSVLENVPDEFYKWIKSTENDFKTNYNEIYHYIQDNFKVLETRKETAEYFKTLKYQGLFFAKLDNKDISDGIWNNLKPIYQKPFITDTE